MREIYRRGSSYYIAYRDHNGNLVRRSCGRDLKEAIEQLSTIRREQQIQAHPFGIFAAFESYMERQKVYSKQRSIKNARSQINRLFEHFGDVEIESLRLT